MKKLLLTALGLLLAVLALGGAIATAHTGDPINLIVTVGLGLGSWRAIRAARRTNPKPATEPTAEQRPWEQ